MFNNLRDKLSPYDLLALIGKTADNLPENITSEDAIFDFQKRAIIVAQYDNSRDGFLIWKHLKNKLQDENDEVKARFREVLLWLQYLCFGKLSQNQIIDFFKNENIGIILSDEFYNDLIGKIKLCLSDLLIEERDVWREKIYTALRQNNNILTQSQISENQKGTISNWLKEYDQAVGIGVADALARSEFESSAPSKAKLSSQEILLLKKLLDLYEFIKYTSYVPAGFEEDIVAVDDETGKEWLLTGGEGIIIDFGNEEEKVQSQNKINNQQNGQIPEKQGAPFPPHSAITQSSHSILTQSNGNLSAILSQLQNSIAFKDIQSALGSLLLIAQLRRLDNVLEDSRFAQMIMNDLRRNKSEDASGGVRANPTAPMHMARFLKIVLEDNLNISNQDALRFGAMLGKIMSIESEKYGSIVKNGKWNM